VLAYFLFLTCKSKTNSAFTSAREEIKKIVFSPFGHLFGQLTIRSYCPATAAEAAITLLLLMVMLLPISLIRWTLEIGHTS
jgi:hypothetical protein